MRTLGILLFILGVFSTALFFLDMNFIFLNWINNWGPDKAWMIRGGIILLGILFYVFGKRSES